MRVPTLVLFSLIALSLTGCNAQMLERDQRGIRTSLLKLYEDQFMDNLIRTKLGLPVLQMDYSSLTGTQENTAHGNLNGSTTSAGGASRAVTRLLGFTAEDTQDGKLTMNGEPIRDPAVYDEFRKFGNNSQFFIVTDQSPANPHIVRQYEGHYYYIPNTPEAREAFLKSYLRVTFVPSQSKGGSFLDNILNELRLNRLNNDTNGRSPR